MDVTILRNFFMWCTIINGAMLIFSWLFLMCAKDWIYNMQSKFFSVSRDAFNVMTYSFIGLFKIVVICFNLVPWIALVIVG